MFKKLYDIYEGNFTNGLKNGYGYLKYYNGVTFKGLW